MNLFRRRDKRVERKACKACGVVFEGPKAESPANPEDYSRIYINGRGGLVRDPDLRMYCKACAKDIHRSVSALHWAQANIDDVVELMESKSNSEEAS